MMLQNSSHGGVTQLETDLSVRILHCNAVLAIVKNVRVAVWSGSQGVEVLVH